MDGESSNTTCGLTGNTSHDPSMFWIQQHERHIDRIEDDQRRICERLADVIVRQRRQWVCLAILACAILAEAVCDLLK